MCFNSRTLGRVRLERGAELGGGVPVSIHAPWEGCDSGRVERLSASDSFNSRTLGRVRPPRHDDEDNAVRVSIHAPWEGCDLSRLIRPLSCVCFNSRTLGRVRRQRRAHRGRSGRGFNSRTLGRVRLPRRPKDDSVGVVVSIHAPWEGCDCLVRELNPGEKVVSIHAPWEGCDIIILTTLMEI